MRRTDLTSTLNIKSCVIVTSASNKGILKLQNGRLLCRTYISINFEVTIYHLLQSDWSTQPNSEVTPSVHIIFQNAALPYSYISRTNILGNLGTIACNKEKKRQIS